MMHEEKYDSPALIDLEKVDTNLLHYLKKTVGSNQPLASVSDVELKEIFKKKAVEEGDEMETNRSLQRTKEHGISTQSIDIPAANVHLLPSCNYAEASSSPSLTNSMINLIFDEKEKAEKQMKTDGNESSLSLIDLDALDDENLFTKDDDQPIALEQLNPLSDQLLRASPIPLAAEMGPRVTKTPVHNPQISSPFKSPIDASRQRPFSISSTMASPITTDNIIASTPFHGRMASSCSEMHYTKLTANVTYNVDDQDQTTNIQNTTSGKVMNVTYDSKTTASNNATFNAPTSGQTVAICNCTFNKNTNEGSTVAQSNETFEIVVGSVHETDVRAPEITTSNVTFDKGNNAPSQDKTKTIRKPLSALNNASDSNVKATMTSVGQKRSSRLQAPRMNTAAISRIQARSPQKPGSGVQDENTSSSTSMKPPVSTTSLRRPQSRKSIAVPRKSLLPPTTSKPRVVTSPGNNAVRKTASPNKSTSDSKSNTSKRKADSPKRPAGRTKTDSGTTRSIPSAPSSLRNSGHVTSRIASLGSRGGSKLQRPQASSLQTPKSVTSSSCTATSATTISGVGVPRSRGTAVKQPKLATKRSHVSLGQKKTKSVNHTSQCVVAMATLLDYVVNRLDGLSAPKLATDKQQLQRLVSDQNRTNDDLSSRVTDLDSALHQSREAHVHDVDDAYRRHNDEVTSMKERYENERKKLGEKLQEISDRLSNQESEHKEIVSKIKEENRKTIQELETNHETTVAQLRLEWSEEREEIEKETLELREKMDALVEEKVQELIQPYINSYEENKSLRAVLEMKNSEHHKLQREMSQHGDQLSEVRTLRDHMISLEQKNEDLQTQVREKNIEQREFKNEISQLRRNLDEQQHVSTNQQQRIEELHYRLNSSSPSPASPFNPVFTPSPTASHPSAGSGLFGGSTPFRSKYGKGSATSSNKRSSNGDDAMTSPRENGTT